jgi:hypothetical protein
VVKVSEYACTWTTPSTVAAPVTVRTNAVASARADEGVNVRVVAVPVTDPVTAPEGPVRVSVPVPVAIGSLNVTVTEPLIGTDRAPLPGEPPTTTGGVLGAFMKTGST